MDAITMYEEGYEKGYRAGKHEMAKNVEELRKDRDYYRDLCSDLYKSIRGMRLEIESMKNENATRCDTCPFNIEDCLDE